MCLDKRVKFISRHKYKQLLQDGIALGHGSDLLGLYDLFTKIIIPPKSSPGLLLLIIYETAVHAIVKKKA